MASWYKMAAFLIVTVIGIEAHRDRSDSDSSSDESGGEVMRRSLKGREWQYEGMAIDYQPRKSATILRRKGNEVKATRTTTKQAEPTTVNPPLDRRYRRIYNADEVAHVEDYPFLAALLVNRKLWCGGAIITSDTILTAAHCLQLQYNNRFFREYVKMLSVRVGSTNATSGGELYRVTEIFFHPNYKPDTLEFNFAALKLHKNMSFDKTEKNIAPIEYSRENVVPTDSQITFLGWGSVLSIGGLGGQVLLQKLELPVYDFADCQEVYGRDLVTRTNFCAGYITVAKNVCNSLYWVSWLQHDAGGPALMGGRLVGVLSFSARRCDSPDKPAVFSRVGAIAPWLDAVGDNRPKLTIA